MILKRSKNKILKLKKIYKKYYDIDPKTRVTGFSHI